MVISDRKLSDITGLMGAVGNFRAEVKNYANVYPFGMEQPGRYLGGEEYRYGYNGMEKDSSSGSERYTTYFRVYDPRVGRWLSVDPITHYDESPYAAMGNNPILMIDPTGSTDTTYESRDGKKFSATITDDQGNSQLYTWMDNPEHKNGGFYQKTNQGSSSSNSLSLPNMTEPYDPVKWEAWGKQVGDRGNEYSGARLVTDYSYQHAWTPNVADYIADQQNPWLNRKMREIAYGTIDDIYVTLGSQYHLGGERVSGTSERISAGIGVLLSAVPGGKAASSVEKEIVKDVIEEVGEEIVKKEASNLWKVGLYKEIQGIEAGLDAHHVGQKKLMERFVQDYEQRSAPAILVPMMGHTRKSPLGRLTTKMTGIENARQLLARDIFQLRKIYPDIPNTALEELINLNKAMYPEAFIKR